MIGRQREALERRVSSAIWKLDDLARQMYEADLRIEAMNVRNTSIYLVGVRERWLTAGKLVRSRPRIPLDPGAAG